MRKIYLLLSGALLFTGCLTRYEKPPQTRISAQPVLHFRTVVKQVVSYKGMLFVGGDKQLICYNEKMQALWEYKSVADINQIFTFADSVFVAQQDKQIIILTLKEGKVVFRQKLAQWIAFSPVVSKRGAYLFGNVGGLYHFDQKNKSIKLIKKMATSFSAKPALHNGLLYAGAFDKKLYCLAPDTGKVVWSVSLPAAVDSPIFFSSRYAYFSCRYFQIVKFDLVQRKVVSLLKEESWVNRMLLHKGYLYYRTHSFSFACRSSRDLSLQWRFRAKQRLFLPVWRGNSIFLLGNKGAVYQLWYSNGMQQGSLQLPGIAYCSPVIFSGQIFLAVGEMLYRLETSPLEVSQRPQYIKPSRGSRF